MTEPLSPPTGDHAVDATARAIEKGTWPQTRAVLRVLLLVLFMAVTLWLVKALVSVLLLVVAAIFFSYLLAPMVELVRKTLRVSGRDVPRSVAIAVTYLGLLAVVLLVGSIVLPHVGRQLSEFSQQLPTYLVTARGRAQGLNSLYSRYHVSDAVRLSINTAAEGAYQGLGTYLQARVQGLLALLLYIPWLVLVPILSFFLLKDAPDFRNSALEALPRGRVRWRGRELFEDLNTTLAAYIRAQLLGCLIVGVLLTMGLALLHVPYAIVLGVIGGALEFIPMVGPVTFAAVALMATSFGPEPALLAVLLFLGGVRVIQDYVIFPRIVRNGVHLHPLAIILAILCGAELGGMVGVFLAIPVVAVLTTLHRHWLEFNGSEGLVADLLEPVERAVTAPPATETLKNEQA